MQFTNGIILESIKVFFERKATVFVVFLLSIGTGILSNFVKTSAGLDIFLSMAIYSLLAISAHQTVINGSFDDKDVTRMYLTGRYVRRLAGITFISLIPALVIGLMFIGRNEGVVLMVVFGVLALSYPITLGLYGTSLPAIAVGGDDTWSTAFHRGTSTLAYVALRLIFLNGGLVFLCFAGFSVIAVYLTSHGLMQKNAIPLWFSLVVTAAITLLSTFITTMASTILSRAYLIVESDGRSAPPSNQTRSVPRQAAISPSSRPVGNQPMFGNRRNMN